MDDLYNTIIQNKTMKKNKIVLLAGAMLAAAGGAGIAAQVDNIGKSITIQEPARNTKQRPQVQQTFPYISNHRRTFLGNSIPKNKPKRSSFLGPGEKKKHNNRIRSNRARKRNRKR